MLEKNSNIYIWLKGRVIYENYQFSNYSKNIKGILDKKLRILKLHLIQQMMLTKWSKHMKELKNRTIQMKTFIMKLMYLNLKKDVVNSDKYWVRYQ